MSTTRTPRGAPAEPRLRNRNPGQPATLEMAYTLHRMLCKGLIQVLERTRPPITALGTARAFLENNGIDARLMEPNKHRDAQLQALRRSYLEHIQKLIPGLDENRTMSAGQMHEVRKFLEANQQQQAIERSRVRVAEPIPFGSLPFNKPPLQ